MLQVCSSDMQTVMVEVAFNYAVLGCLVKVGVVACSEAWYGLCRRMCFGLFGQYSCAEGLFGNVGRGSYDVGLPLFWFVRRPWFSSFVFWLVVRVGLQDVGFEAGGWYAWSCGKQVSRICRKVETQQVVPTIVTDNETVEVTKVDETTPASEVLVSEPVTTEQPKEEAAVEAAVEKEAETEVPVEVETTEVAEEAKPEVENPATEKVEEVKEEATTEEAKETTETESAAAPPPVEENKAAETAAEEVATEA